MSDWWTYIGTISGVIGLGITIWTLIRTGKIQKAVILKEKEVKSQVSYAMKKDRFLAEIDKLKFQDSLLFNHYREFYTLLGELEYCSLEFSDKDKETIKEAKEFCETHYYSCNQNNNLPEKITINLRLHIDKIDIILRRRV